MLTYVPVSRDSGPHRVTPWHRCNDGEDRHRGGLSVAPSAPATQAPTRYWVEWWGFLWRYAAFWIAISSQNFQRCRRWTTVDIAAQRDKLYIPLSWYLDNFIILGCAGSTQCMDDLAALKLVCTELGVPLAVDKCAGPATCITFLGIEVEWVPFPLLLKSWYSLFWQLLYGARAGRVGLSLAIVTT